MENTIDNLELHFLCDEDNGDNILQASPGWELSEVRERFDCDQAAAYEIMLWLTDPQAYAEGLCVEVIFIN